MIWSIFLTTINNSGLSLWRCARRPLRQTKIQILQILGFLKTPIPLLIIFYVFTNTYLGVNWIINTLSVLVTVVVCAIYAALQQQQSYFAKVKLLCLQLIILSFLFIKYKNEQYLPIYLLVEFGTLIFLYSLFKGINSSTKNRQKTTTLLMLTPVILVGYLSTTKAGIYWVNVSSNYVDALYNFGDFDSLKIGIVLSAEQVIVPLFSFILVLTSMLVLLNSKKTLKKLKTQHAWLSLKVDNTNRFDEYSSKKTEPTVNKFN